MSICLFAGNGSWVQWEVHNLMTTRNSFQLISFLIEIGIIFITTKALETVLIHIYVLHYFKECTWFGQNSEYTT